MDKKWIQILVVLVFCQHMTSGAGEDRIVAEGHQCEITCRPEAMGSMIVWFRVLDTSGMEFIGSFSNTGFPKSTSPPSIFVYSKIKENVLILKSFSNARDSGVYICASLVGGKELKFGNIIRLIGEKVQVETQPPTTTTTTTTTKPALYTTATPCDCNKNNKREETSSEMSCSAIILGPLAGGCGLLLLLLIISTMYCNKIRTRRCPHHYKRKPRMVAPGKQMMTNRHV